MPEFTDLYCNSPETAKAVEAYLGEQLSEIEAIDRPEIHHYIAKSTLRLTYSDQMSGDERRAWDMQLMGFRDGYDEGRKPQAHLLEM